MFRDVVRRELPLSLAILRQDGFLTLVLSDGAFRDGRFTGVAFLSVPHGGTRFSFLFRVWDGSPRLFSQLVFHAPFRAVSQAVFNAVFNAVFQAVSPVVSLQVYALPLATTF